MRTRSISPHANVDKAQTTPTPGPSRYAVPAQPLQELGLVALKPSEPTSSEVPKVQSAPMPSIVPSSPGIALEVPTGASIDQTVAKPVIVPSSVSLVQAAPTTTTVPNGVAVVQATAVPAMAQRQMLTIQVPSAVTMAEVRPTTPVNMRTRSISPHANVDKAQTTPTRREAASQPGPSRYAVPAQPLQELGLVALKPSEPTSSEVPKMQSAPMPSIVPSSPGTALEVPTGASIDQTVAKPVIVPSSVSLVQAAPTTTTVPNGVAVVQATAVPAMA